MMSNDEIVIVDYDPVWPQRFEQEAQAIRRTLEPELLFCIEHFGSTAIPGLAAKPIIDMLVGVTSLEQAKRIAIAPLQSIGYAYWADNPDPTRMFFVKGLPRPEVPNSGPRTHHLHLVEPNSPPHWERIKFRDYLRQHPEEAQCYEGLKRKLAEQFRGDREAYTRGKTSYVNSVLRKTVE